MTHAERQVRYQYGQHGNPSRYPRDEVPEQPKGKVQGRTYHPERLRNRRHPVCRRQSLYGQKGYRQDHIRSCRTAGIYRVRLVPVVKKLSESYRNIQQNQPIVRAGCDIVFVRTVGCFDGNGGKKSMSKQINNTKAGLYYRLSQEDERSGESLSIENHVLICIGWILPPNTYDCGSFVANGMQL